MGRSPSPPVAVTVRHLRREDEVAFHQFAEHISEGELRFLKEDLSDATRSFSDFFSTGDSQRLVAIDDDGAVLGLAGAFPGQGWSAHVAELRVLVAPAHRNRGAGRALAHAALIDALDRGCSQAFVEVVAGQEALVAMFQDMGFLPEALLPDFVRDADGHYHDLMLLTHRASEYWSRTQVLGLDEITS